MFLRKRKLLSTVGKDEKFRETPGAVLSEERQKVGEAVVNCEAGDQEAWAGVGVTR